MTRRQLPPEPQGTVRFPIGPGIPILSGFAFALPQLSVIRETENGDGAWCVKYEHETGGRLGSGPHSQGSFTIEGSSELLPALRTISGSRAPTMPLLTAIHAYAVTERAKWNPMELYAWLYGDSQSDRHRTAFRGQLSALLRILTSADRIQIDISVGKDLWRFDTRSDGSYLTVSETGIVLAGDVHAFLGPFAEIPTSHMRVGSLASPERNLSSGGKNPNSSELYGLRTVAGTRWANMRRKSNPLQPIGIGELYAMMGLPETRLKTMRRHKGFTTDAIAELRAAGMLKARDGKEIPTVYKGKGQTEVTLQMPRKVRRLSIVREAV